MRKGRHFLFPVKNSSYEGKGTQDTPGYRFFRFFSRKLENNSLALQKSGADLGGAGDAPPPSKMTCGFLIQLVFSKKNQWFVGVEVKHETWLKNLCLTP